MVCPNCHQYTQTFKWIKCSDRLPPQDHYVLVARYDGRPKVKMYFIQIASRLDNEWFEDKDGYKFDPKFGKVTHWMPLPEVPILDE